jgi:hypothetical protein
MRFLKTLLLVPVLCLAAHSLSAQSLLRDSKVLLDALATINDSGMVIKDTLVMDTLIRTINKADTSYIDTVAYKSVRHDTSYSAQAVEIASARILAILYNYNNPIGEASFSQAQLHNITHSYRNNPQIKKLIGNERHIFPDSVSTFFIQRFEEELYILRRSPRQKIIKLLHSDDDVSPANYLSVSNALERYSIPPVENTTALQLAAEGSNQNISRGIVSAPYIIEGLFDVILKRAEEEVAISFLQQLLGKNGVEDFREIFPTVVSTFGGQDFTYSNSFLERLRQAFYEDLQLLSIRLPALMLKDEYFKALQDDPITYSLLVVYSMAGMAQNGYEIDEILPITSRYLDKTYQEAQKKVNFYLAEHAVNSPEYKEVITTTQSIVDQLSSIYVALDTSEAKINRLITGVEQRFGVDAPPSLQSYLNKPNYDFEKLIQGDGSTFDLTLLPYLLKGELDRDFILRYNTLEEYDKFFSVLRSSEQWRAAGLELARNLNGTRIEDSSIDKVLINWQQDLALYALEAQRWQNTVDPEGALQQALARADQNRERLRQTVLETKEYWKGQLIDDQPLAFDLLAKILDNFDDITEDPNLLLQETLQLEQMKARLLGVERRLMALNKMLVDAHPGMGASSPLEAYLNQEAATPFSHISSEINRLSISLQDLRLQLGKLDNEQAKSVSRERDNAAPLLQITEVLTQLAYSLRSDNDTYKWVTKGQLSQILDGGERQEAFLGLMQQRLINTKNFGRFSPDGLAQLIELTVRDLPSLVDKSNDEVRDSLAFYRRASFAANTFNRILELPLIVRPFSKTNEFIPLEQQDPVLASLPDVTKQAMDFIYYLNVKDHSHAISSAIRLFSSLDTAIVAMNPAITADAKRQPLLNFMREYGDFIAGLIDARSSNQVKSLINGISDPPGSSRLKRRAPLSVSLNAYLGGTIGMESWEIDGRYNDPFFSLSPTMPVGINISWLWGKKDRSYSAFFSFFDLGAMLTYHSIDNLTASAQFTFKNVFKPGLQFQYNLKNSPFYLAAGAQYGPQFLEDAAGEETSVNSVRGFLGFGIDVPLKTLYQK